MTIQYRRILELAPDHSQRSIAASTGHSRRKVKEVIERAQQVELTMLIETELTAVQVGRSLFPELSPETTGREAPNVEYMYEQWARSRHNRAIILFRWGKWQYFQVWYIYGLGPDYCRDHRSGCNHSGASC